jgi:hypothetical protein
MATKIQLEDVEEKKQQPQAGPELVKQHGGELD